jgi:hypothetical protein
LRIELYERVQAHAESLAHYVESIRESALILRITETEAQMVQRIVEGLNPIQRARFVFQGPPNNIADLEQLIVVDRNFMFADQIRGQNVATCSA